MLTPNLLRLEYSESGCFEDRPSQVVLNRGFEEGCRALGKAVRAQTYDPATRTLTVELAPIATKEPLTVTLENAAVFANRQFREDVFDFLMEAQLPVELKTEINGICSSAYSKEDIAQALNNTELTASTRHALYEIVFCR